jgi:hypothetical protein
MDQKGGNNPGKGDYRLAMVRGVCVLREVREERPRSKVSFVCEMMQAPTPPASNSPVADEERREGKPGSPMVVEAWVFSGTN